MAAVFGDYETLAYTQSTSDSDEEFPQTQSHPLFNTLFPDFDRPVTQVSPPSSPSSASRRRPDKSSNNGTTTRNDHRVDLRALDYVSTYDSHLMCPICHVPFVDPLVLSCDHTFCSTCLEEYREGARSSDQPQCPTCRAQSLDSSRKASRLIINMCNDIKVRCPNEGCDLVFARGNIEQHATKDCTEFQLRCPGHSCDKLIRKKNFIPDQCIHTSEVQCECGATIELGKGAWLEHKDKDCPLTAIKCDNCGERVLAKEYFANKGGHICQNEVPVHTCPGAEYGCTDEFDQFDLKSHSKSCPFARLAPHLKKQSQLLQSLQDQLAQTKLRNESLEAQFDIMNALLNNPATRNLPYTSTTSSSRAPSEPDLDIEEIPRDHIPSNRSSLNHPRHHNTQPAHRDLILPAHLRDLTPSPSSSPQAASHNHLLALHESLRTTVTTLEHSLTSLSHTVNDIEARTSMSLMNETLRLKEEIAHTNAAMFSTRAQVQWLLNRERIGAQQAAMGMGGVRGRTSSSTQNQPTIQSVNVNANATANVNASASSTTLPTSPPTDPTHIPTIANLGAGPSSSARSSFSDHDLLAFQIPTASSLGVGIGGAAAGPSNPGSSHASPRVRPINRRLSGSQERVKL